MLVCIALVVVLISIQGSTCEPGDPVMYLPPFEVRTMGGETRPVVFPQQQFSDSQLQFQPVDQQVSFKPQQQIIHTTHTAQSTPQPAEIRVEKPHTKKHNFTLDEFVEAVNELAENKEVSHDHDESRAAEREEYPSYPAYPAYSPYSPYPAYPRPYGHPSRPNYAPYSPPAAYVPPTAVHHSASKKPELSSLFKPVTTKVAGKVSGFITLLLALMTGSSPDDLEFKGFKDIVINGIVKPLLIAKGGIKSLISKLVIPVISLLLINLEVLITIWWLWEDCPEPVHAQAPPVYPYPKPAYNNYHSYR